MEWSEGYVREVGRPAYIKTGVHGINARRTGYAGVRAPIRAMKPGNAGGAKGCRKMDAL